jgi:hypothetical protein
MRKLPILAALVSGLALVAGCTYHDYEYDSEREVEIEADD